MNVFFVFNFFICIHVYVHTQDKATADEQQSWGSFKTMTTEPSSGSGGQKMDRVELHSKSWDTSSANTPDTSEGDFQTEV